MRRVYTKRSNANGVVADAGNGSARENVNGVIVATLSPGMLFVLEQGSHILEVEESKDGQFLRFFSTNRQRCETSVVVMDATMCQVLEYELAAWRKRVQ